MIVSKKNTKPLTDKQIQILLKTPWDKLTSVFPDRSRRWLLEQKRAHKEGRPPETIAAIDAAMHKERSDKLQTQAKYRAIIKERNKLRTELDALTAISGHSGKKTISIRSPKGRHEATAVALASDWHAEEPVDREKVSGLNEFSLDIFSKRSSCYFRNLVRMIKKEQQDVTIQNLVLWLGGDFFTSNIHEDTAESNSLGPIDAVLLVQESISGGIQYILDNTDVKITIPCSSGNHGRITKGRRIKTEDENSLERYMYINLAKEYRSENRIAFILPHGYHTYLDIHGYVVRFHHGHSMNYGGGVGGITIPVNKAIAQWNRARTAYLDCFGHFHQFIDGGSFIGNGSLIGYNEFALSIKAPYEPPRQAFFLIDSKHGKTVVAPIILEEK